MIGAVCLCLGLLIWYKTSRKLGKLFEKETALAICQDTFQAMKVNKTYKWEKPEKNLFFRFNAFQNDILVYFYQNTTFSYFYFSSYIIYKNILGYSHNSVASFFQELKSEDFYQNGLIQNKLRISTLIRRFFVYCHENGYVESNILEKSFFRKLKHEQIEMKMDWTYNEPNTYFLNLKMSQEIIIKKKVENCEYSINSSLDLFLCTNCEITESSLAPINFKTFEYFYHSFCRIMDLPVVVVDLQHLNSKYGLKTMKIKKEYLLFQEIKNENSKLERFSSKNNEDENEKFYQNYRNDSELLNQENSFGSKNFLIMHTKLMVSNLIITIVNTILFSNFYSMLLDFIHCFNMNKVIFSLDLDKPSLFVYFKTRAFAPAFADKDYFNGSVLTLLLLFFVPTWLLVTSFTSYFLIDIDTSFTLTSFTSSYPKSQKNKRLLYFFVS